jgi:hypothetical protein
MCREQAVKANRKDAQGDRSFARRLLRKIYITAPETNSYPAERFPKVAVQEKQKSTHRGAQKYREEMDHA